MNTFFVHVLYIIFFLPHSSAVCRAPNNEDVKPVSPSSDNLPLITPDCLTHG